ncbi:LOW QUALITY PROTEIN: Uncharacterized RNA-binding protein [Saitozyma sp. JCM 24511]|nr:LOW QUALITY PROTEIN: Uncharacterized RNA-binding protein [Saitozyma sp. JCM 24511]
MSGQASYTPEEHAAAYYAQQGYTPDQIAAATSTYYDPSTYASSSSYGGGGDGGGGPSSSYGAGVPGAFQTISVTPAGGGSGTHTPVGGHAQGNPRQGQVFDTDLIAQSSIYDPGATQPVVKEGKGKPPQGKRETVIRHGKGRTWEDPTLLDWDPKWYRLFVGDVSNDVNERTLNDAFNQYPSYCKCKVVKDRLSLKSKYAFIAFKDPEDFLKAWKEMDGKYVGNRPIRLSKVRDDQYGSIATTAWSQGE